MADTKDDNIAKRNETERREETNRAFAEITEREHRARLEKTMRLRPMRLVEGRSSK